MSTEQRLSIGELAERTGVSRRAVRFYVQQGLLSAPTGRGRGSAYTEAHVDQILRIRQLQRDGLVLETIRQLDEAPARSKPTASPGSMRAASLVRIELAPGLRLEVDAGRVIPAPYLLQAICEACRNILAGTGAFKSESSAASGKDTPAPRGAATERRHQKRKEGLQ